MTGFINTFLVQSLLITISYKNLHSIFSRTPLPWLPRTRSILILVLRLDYLYVQSRGGPAENTSVAQQWIYVSHIENTASSIIVFTALCIKTEVIRLLLAYLLSRIVVGYT
jgi:hypothetical protein